MSEGDLFKIVLVCVGIIEALMAMLWFSEKSFNRETRKKTEEVEESLRKDYYTKNETDDRIFLHNQPLKESIDRNTEVTEELVKVIRTLHSDVAVLKSRSRGDWNDS